MSALLPMLLALPVLGPAYPCLLVLILKYSAPHPCLVVVVVVVVALIIIITATNLLLVLLLLKDRLL
jgi:hypothetical protein